MILKEKEDKSEKCSFLIQTVLFISTINPKAILPPKKPSSHLSR